MDSELYQFLIKLLYTVGGLAGVGVFIVALLYLLSKKWFWFISAGIFCFFSIYLTLKSIYDQRYLGALIYAFLTWVCWSITDIAIKNIPHDDNQGYPEQPHSE